MISVISKSILLFQVFICQNGAVSSSVSKQPDIILIVADDLGFHDVPWHNKDVYAPNLLKLSKMGVILEQSYVQPICTPTRAAILTGRYPFTIGRQNSIIWPLMPTGLTLEAPTIPELLKPLGYDTHAVGKWHLGFCKWAYTPTERGFDTFRGYYTGSEDYYTHVRDYGSEDYYTHARDYGLSVEEASAADGHFRLSDFDPLNIKNSTFRDAPMYYDFRDNRKAYLDAYGTYSTHVFASHVEDILKNGQPETPKFIYMAFQSVHAPLEVPSKYLEHYKHIKDINRRTYLGMVSAMDEAIGRLVSALKKANRYSNSVIVFSTDNGGPTAWGGNNWPLRGNKTTLWEGGTRGAAFVHSPQLIPNNSVSKTLVHTTDWLATLVNLAGGIVPNNTNSIDQWSAIRGQAKEPPRKAMVYNINYQKPRGFQAAVRLGKYKLILGNPGPGDWTPPPEIGEKLASFFMKIKNLRGHKFWRQKQLFRIVKKMKNCRDSQCFLSHFHKYVNETNHGEMRQPTRKLLNKFAEPVLQWLNDDEDTGAEKAEEGTERASLDETPSGSDEPVLNFADFKSVPDVLSKVSEVRLYDLEDDPEERSNLASSMPDQVEKLTNLLLSYKDQWVPPDDPKNDPKGDPHLWGGVWSPGWC